MGSAGTFVGKLAVLTNRNTGQIIAASGIGFSAEIHHHALPLSTVRLDPSQSVEAVDHIMGHLMGNRVANTVFKIFCKEPGVVANTATAALDLIHTGALAPEIKMHGDGVETSPVKLRRFFNTALGGRLNLAHLQFRDWLNHVSQYTWSEPVTIRQIARTANK